MVDFRSPAVLALNSCAYHGLSISLCKLNIPIGLFSTVSLDRLSHTIDGIYLYV